MAVTQVPTDVLEFQFAEESTIGADAVTSVLPVVGIAPFAL
jgi:hypothetical protein